MPYLIVPFLIGGFFLTIFVGMNYLFAWISGWQALASRFRAYTRPEGVRFSFVGAKVGVLRYKNALFITVADEGLYISVFFMMRLFNPPILIPWKELCDFQVEKGLFGITFYRIQVCEPVVTTLVLPKRVVEAIIEGGYAS